jgi:hypothetical protein
MRSPTLLNELGRIAPIHVAKRVVLHQEHVKNVTQRVHVNL